MVETTFLQFLEAGVARGGFETDDVLGALLPLMKQTLGAHAAGNVAPLRGVGDLLITPEGTIQFNAAKAAPALHNRSKVESMQAEVSRGIVVVGESRQNVDVSAGLVSVQDLAVAGGGENFTRPVFRPDYEAWEHAVGHHDELTDIFSLGLLLASIACGLDFTNEDELEHFASSRTNLFALNPRLNPVLASVIVQMTELNRHKRAPDLAQVIRRLETYREQPGEIDFKRLKGFAESGVSGKRRLIQSHLRDRLFEISRRNRLIHFKPTLQTLNLTIASVPLLLDYRNIRLEQLFVWHPELAAAIVNGAPMSLGKYLRFEDAPYIPGALDKLISEARRDRAEYGFGQLRLVICFLRWHNLKEDSHERIHSPLLLLPVELSKKKGVRDNYVLDPTSAEAEVNPALRHHLRELYGLRLPETVDLRETTLDQFYESLKAMIHASEPGVTLNKIDRPQIELIHQRAKQRVDQYRRRQQVRVRSTPIAKPEYSYDREDFRPLGLQLFLKKIRPVPIPLRTAAGGISDVRIPQMAEEPAGEVIESANEMFALRGTENRNPYSWDFDLCGITLGNFNYRKMTLVRDYSKLIETDMASDAFDTVFSLQPKAPEETAPAALPPNEQHLIVPCDATQASAIARARTGASYIIQGPPGTGKSQTITNLIADYVARGKRVLFVCEKRAAIDIVFHRLRQQGLDEVCCLIHDSQTDKKAFVQNLKQTYDNFLTAGDRDADIEKARQKVIAAIEHELGQLRRFSEIMRQPHPSAGLPVRDLIRRLVELRGRSQELAAEIEDLLPHYPQWIEHGAIVERLGSAFVEAADEEVFAKHPVRWVGRGALEADRPLETLNRRLDEAETLLDAIENALELSGLPAELWDTFEEIQAVLEFASRALPLAERNLVSLLAKTPAAEQFNTLAQNLDDQAKAVAAAKAKTTGWKNALEPSDTENALRLARGFENSILRFLNPGFWRLRKTLNERYNFSQHAVPPSWTALLEDLNSFHAARAALTAVEEAARGEWKASDVPTFRDVVAGLRADPKLSHASVKALIDRMGDNPDAGRIIRNLADIHARFQHLDQTLSIVLAEHHGFNFAELTEVLAELREAIPIVDELLPALRDLLSLPDHFNHALRHAEVPLKNFEAAIGEKSLRAIYRQDRALNRIDSRQIARHMAELEKHHRELLKLNARAIRARVRQNFRDHVNISSLPAAQLNAEQKNFKKSYAAGRRDVEHEFGKSMRYKSIRDLAADDSGRVIQDLKPIWLMSPLSVSDTLPLEPNLFDVVIFDEASQIPVEEAIPSLYRGRQVIVVGDEMQLPPTTFFASQRSEDETVTIEEEGERIEVDLDSDSFLTQSATNLPSTLLAWHYRSRYEALISFSNAAFYSGNLFTIPDRQFAAAKLQELRVRDVAQGDTNVDETLARSISFHFMENGLYDDRHNAVEAAYIARLLRGLLQRQTGLNIGIVAFSEAQQSEIEDALTRLSDEDEAFATQLEAEFVREENDQFCGLFVKNLENVQGDERDIIILSVCYGPDASGRMLMNFGPINQRGGEKRLNVIFSRAKQHMAVVSSIRYERITNDYNDGANYLKKFLRYAEAVSKGDQTLGRTVLEDLNPLSRKALAPTVASDSIIEKIADALRERGHVVDLNVGQSRFRCDLAIRATNEPFYQMGLMVDTSGHYANENLLDRYLMQPGILRAFGWRVALILSKDWFENPDDVLARIEKMLSEKNDSESVPPPEATPEPAVETKPGPLAATLAPSPPLTTAPIDQPSPVTAAPVTPTPAFTRRLEFIAGASRKFWNITVSGNSFSVRFGRIGTAGQEQTKTFASEAQARIEAENLVSEKLRKGYAEIS